jgi:hypothetical protein
MPSESWICGLDFTRKLIQAVGSTAGSTHINALQTTPAYSYNTLQELHCIILRRLTSSLCGSWSILMYRCCLVHDFHPRLPRRVGP